MKFGIVLPNYGADATRLGIIDTALSAERLGFDSVWTTDHLALPKSDAERFGLVFEAVTTLSFLAGSTGRIHLGISALVLPQRNPVEVAKELATLDVLSGGRVILAAGVGWSEGEYGNLGHDFHTRGKRMDEALKVLRTLWRGLATASFSGKYYNFKEVVFAPQTVQSGGPPLWVAGDSPAALKRAIYYADGWHPHMDTPENLSNALKPARALIGKRPFTVSLRMRVNFGTPAESHTELSGTPEGMIEKLKEFSQAGATYAVLFFPAASQGVRERAMQAFAREVMPALADDQ